MFTVKRMSLLLLPAVTSVLANAQCEKNVKFVTEKVYQVKGDSTEGDQLPVTGSIRLSKDSIFVFMQWQSGETTEVRGSDTQINCRMNSDYKEGTIEIASNAEITVRGQTNKTKMLFNILSKEGKIKVYAVPENESEKICFAIREWQEIN